MSDRQETTFAAGEGDRYFGRNRAALEEFDVERDPIIRLVRDAGLEPRSIIEVGAAAGHRVAALADAFECRGVAVDPSSAAVEAGRLRYPGIELHVGAMDAVPVADEFDLVIVNFVFHWVARSLLLRSMAEVDRLTRDEGHVAIGDFMPAGLMRTPYHHSPGLWTFKQDYPAAFTASGIYCRVAVIAGEYGSRVPSRDPDPGNRVGYALLHKSLNGHYQETPMSQPPDEPPVS